MLARRLARNLFRTVIVFQLVAALVAVEAVAQTSSAPQAPKKPGPLVASGVGVPERGVRAPQVVTIVHRLNGLKMFRLLLRSDEQVEAIARLDDSFKFMDDVHTNVIAGLAMDDGRTIVAWLPEAEVELGMPMIPFTAPGIPAGPLAPPLGTSKPVATLPASQIRQEAPFPGMSGNFFEPADLTVIGPDGRHLPAHYVGLDGVTGLSILTIAGPNLNTPTAAEGGKENVINVGQTVRVFGPEPAARTPASANGSVYVRMGETPGTVLTVTRVPMGRVVRFKVRSPRLSLANIGGVAVNEVGETLGIVDGIDGGEASILPAIVVRQAARRVLARQMSVPKPWLGVKGEPVTAFNLEQIQHLGWQIERATTLAYEHNGILLTWIAPGSPASLAALRAGDVILKVNDEAVRTADDFSWLLEQAGPRGSVRFTVARPDHSTPEAVSVRLSEALNSQFAWTMAARGRGLIDQGIETIALKPVVAVRLGASGGLLTVYVQPSTAAFKAGLRPGDVIESIDGKQISLLPEPMLLPGAAYKLDIVRNRQKLVIAVDKSQPQN